MTTLLILPGLDGMSVMHDAFFAALGPGFDVKLVRYPSQAVLGYDELESVARASLPERGTCVILGESFSGPLAIRLAAAMPEKISGLILCASFVRSPRPGLRWLTPLIRHMPISGALVARLSPLFAGKAASPELLPKLVDILSTVSPGALRARLCAALKVDASTEYAALAMPLLCLRATHDRIVPRHAAEYAATLNPRTRIVEINAPHFMLQTQPVEAARAVAQFINETRPSRLEKQTEHNALAQPTLT